MSFGGGAGFPDDAAADAKVEELTTLLATSFDAAGRAFDGGGGAFFARGDGAGFARDGGGAPPFSPRARDAARAAAAYGGGGGGGGGGGAGAGPGSGSGGSGGGAPFAPPEEGPSLYRGRSGEVPMPIPWGMPPTAATSFAPAPWPEAGGAGYDGARGGRGGGDGGGSFGRLVPPDLRPVDLGVPGGGGADARAGGAGAGGAVRGSGDPGAYEALMTMHSHWSMAMSSAPAGAGAGASGGGGGGGAPPAGLARADAEWLARHGVGGGGGAWLDAHAEVGSGADGGARRADFVAADAAARAAAAAAAASAATGAGAWGVPPPYAALAPAQMPMRAGPGGGGSGGGGGDGGDYGGAGADAGSQSYMHIPIVTDDIRAGRELRTTVMVRHIPSRYTQAQLIEEIASTGFRDKVDFVYQPVDFRNGCR